MSAMNMPVSVRRILQQLYANCRTTITLRGLRFTSFYILSCIKQGCPASGTIFALAIDPVLRFMIDNLPPRIARFGAYADDIATVFKHMPRDLPPLLDIFILVGRATALHIKMKKCVIVPRDQRKSIADHRRAIAAVAPMFADAKIEFHAKYLGAVIGPTAHLVHWAAPGAKFLDRVRWLRAQDGACASLAAKSYRMFASQL